MKDEKIKQAANEYATKQGGLLTEKTGNAFIAGANFGRELGMKDGWIDVNDHLPDKLETVWITNGKGWTTLGCWSYFDENEWCWAETNGAIYQYGDEIVAECESGDLDVKYWHRLPKAIKV